MVKHLIHTLNKAFDHRVRLGVMAVLMANDLVSFNDLKEALDLTDGNLASHVAALEKAGYVTVSKQFVGKKPNTTYTASTEGKQAFQEHLNALEKLLKGES
ncbi:transcriptional regulator [Hymenobacter crusticola]|uniref:Transcriptional regulator n=1 Tax=Hymenobacter crusticola TaxID=1770526 RepID=A0A243WJC8_9BACT|nr:transcriptional regulator [Hymenobacter crusticola]